MSRRHQRYAYVGAGWLGTVDARSCLRRCHSAMTPTPSRRRRHRRLVLSCLPSRHMPIVLIGRRMKICNIPCRLPSTALCVPGAALKNPSFMIPRFCRGHVNVMGHGCRDWTRKDRSGRSHPLPVHADLRARPASVTISGSSPLFWSALSMACFLAGF